MLCFGDKEHGPWDQMAWLKSWPCYLLTLSLWTDDSPLCALGSLSIKMGIRTVPTLGAELTEEINAEEIEQCLVA